MCYASLRELLCKGLKIVCYKSCSFNLDFGAVIDQYIASNCWWMRNMDNGFFRILRIQCRLR